MNPQLVAEPEIRKKAAAVHAPQAATVAAVVAFPTAIQPRQLFSQSFVELSPGDRRRKRVTQTGSFIVQAIIVVILVLIPLWFVDVLPVQQLATFLVAPPPPPPPPPPAAAVAQVTRVTEVVNGALKTPTKIPQTIKMIKEEAPPASGGVIGGVEGGVPGGTVGGVLGALLPTTHTNTQAPIAAPLPVKRIKVSTGISEGMLEHRVEPIYPSIAARARIAGTVQLRAIISKQGTIENLQVVNGHPLLIQSAMDAVKQWRYRPYVLNGEPLEVETIVIVNFNIN